MRVAPKTSSPGKMEVRASLLGFKEKSHIVQLHFCSGPRHEYPQALNSQTCSPESMCFLPFMDESSPPH